MRVGGRSFNRIVLGGQLMTTVGSARQLPAQTTHSLGTRLVRIEPGTFDMGDTPGPDCMKPGRDRYDGPHWDEAPVHGVRISYPFLMATAEETNEAYARFRPDHRANLEARGIAWESDAPATMVTWNDAAAYCAWISKREGKTYRLPTEAEWEFAARNAGAFGLRGLGNKVHEWCHDWWAPYSEAPQTEPVGPANGTVRVIRGGRPANRGGSVPGDRRALLGFRVVQAELPDAEPLPTPEPARAPGAERPRALARDRVIPSRRLARDGTEREGAPLRALAGSPRGTAPELARVFCDVAQKTRAWTVPVDPPEPFFEGLGEYIDRPTDHAQFPYWGRHHVPSLTWCDNGDLLATAFTAPNDASDQMAIIMTRLRNGTNQWDPPTCFFIAPDRNVTSATLFHAGNGELHHYNGLGAIGVNRDFSMVKRVSTDHGATWGELRIVHKYPAQPVSMKTFTGEPRLWPHMDIVVLEDGTLVMPSDVGGGEERGTVLFESRDGGESWSERTRFGWNHERFAKKGDRAGWIAGIHAPFIVLEDGRYLAFGRSNNIDGRSPFSLSADRGKTWTYQPSPFPPISSGQRPILRRLAEGPILLVSYTDRRGSKNGLEIADAAGQRRRIYGMFAALSLDEGQTWPHVKLIPRHPRKPDLADGGGYLSCVQTPNRTIHLLSSSRYYRFNLAWLKQPHPRKELVQE